MDMFRAVCILYVITCFTHAVPLNSTYAKVKTWGSAQTPAVEGRSSGQTLYTHRSDAKIRSGQNMKPKEVIYHYSMDSISKIGEDKTEKLPAKGEVIQDRFNPPPYFDFNSEESKDLSKPSIMYSSPGDMSSQNSDAKPSMNPYDSPISSYIPPSSGLPNGPKEPSYDSPISSYNPPSSGVPNGPKESSYDSPISSYNPPSSGVPNRPKEPSYDSPISSYNPMPSGIPDMPKIKPSHYHPPSQYQKPKFPGYLYNGDQFSGPYAPVDDLYDSPKPKQKIPSFGYEQPSPPNSDESKDMYMPQNNEDMKTDDAMYGPPDDKGPPIAQTVDAPSDYIDKPDFDQHQHHQHHHHHHQPNDFQLSPPPARLLPDFIYNGGGYPHDHHHVVYHEVTTTTEAPEDERVNKGHYSYYYLGRKLWYIPLYFSVYFIVYITVLILKSIARHKVTFAHDLQDLGSKGRSGHLTELNANVTSDIDDFKRRYIAM